MGTISHLPRRDRPQPTRLFSEVEAEAAAAAFTAARKHAPDMRFALRREALKLSGLAAISLTAEAGGLDCCNAILAGIVGNLQGVDPDAADALHRHYVALEHFRRANDERFYEQLSEQVLSGDLLFSAPEDVSQELDVSHEDFQTLAAGKLLVPASALWADWLWLEARNQTAGAVVRGSALVPLRAAIIETPSQSVAGDRVSIVFRSAPVAHGIWGEKAELSDTGQALDHLLQAARIAALLDLDDRATARRSIARAALEALVGQAAAALDHAQVDPTRTSVSDARKRTLEAAMFAADLAGNELRFQQLAAHHPAFS